MKTLNDTEENILKDYIKLKVSAKSIEKELDKLKPIVKDILVSVNAEDNPIQTDSGKMYLRPRRRWTYSPELEARMNEVEAAQKYEEATGKATPETSYDVYFKGN